MNKSEEIALALATVESLQTALSSLHKLLLRFQESGVQPVPSFCLGPETEIADGFKKTKRRWNIPPGAIKAALHGESRLIDTDHSTVIGIVCQIEEMESQKISFPKRYLSRQELAECLDVSASTISRWQGTKG